jgi:hypothetical protein
MMNITVVQKRRTIRVLATCYVFETLSLIHFRHRGERGLDQAPLIRAKTALLGRIDEREHLDTPLALRDISIVLPAVFLAHFFFRVPVIMAW